MSRILRGAAARQDLVDIVYYYIRKRSPSSALRFREAAEAAFRRLAAMPGMGTRFDTTNPAFEEVRYFPLPSRFKKYLVFYRTTSDGIEIIRVLHGARDIGPLLEYDSADG